MAGQGVKAKIDWPWPSFPDCLQMVKTPPMWKHSICDLEITILSIDVRIELNSVVGFDTRQNQTKIMALINHWCLFLEDKHGWPKFDCNQCKLWQLHRNEQLLQPLIGPRPMRALVAFVWFSLLCVVKCLFNLVWGFLSKTDQWSLQIASKRVQSFWQPIISSPELEKT